MSIGDCRLPVSWNPSNPAISEPQVRKAGVSSPQWSGPMSLFRSWFQGCANESPAETIEDATKPPSVMIRRELMETSFGMSTCQAPQGPSSFMAAGCCSMERRADSCPLVVLSAAYTGGIKHGLHAHGGIVGD